MVGVAEDFEGTAELLGAKGGVKSEEDLDHRNRSISAVLYCTHLDLCLYYLSMVLNSSCMYCASIRVVFRELSLVGQPRCGDPALVGASAVLHLSYGVLRELMLVLDLPSMKSSIYVGKLINLCPS